MKNILWVLPIILSLHTNDSYSADIAPNSKRSTNSELSLPAYKILKECFGIKLKWHQRIKYRLLQLGYQWQIQDEEKKIKRAKKMGLYSLIASSLGIVLLWIVPVAGLILAVAAIVGGWASLKRNPTRGTSIAAIIIGGSTLVFTLLAALLMLQILFAFL